MKNANLKILDCTLRDGGYYNDWRFSRDTVQSYIKGINDSKIDILEIGFRFLKKNNLGIFANSIDKHINRYNFRKNLKIAIMINASDFDLSKNYKSNYQNIYLKKKTLGYLLLESLPT